MRRLIGLIVLSSIGLAEGADRLPPHLDRAFGVDGFADLSRPGRAMRNFGSDPAFISVAVDSGGRTYSLFSAPLWIGGPSSVLATRPDGRPDETFGVHGVVDLPKNSIGSIDVDSHDRLVLSGVALATPTDSRPTVPVLERLTRDGALDATFGVGGVAVLGAPTNFGPPTVARIPDGSDAWLALVQRETLDRPPYGGYERSVVRIDATGALDATYDGALPPVPPPSPPTAPMPYIGQIAADASGRLLLCEVSNSYVPVRRGVVTVTRLTPSGGPDWAFGTGGSAILGFDDGAGVQDMKVDGSGRPLLLVRAPAQALVRLTPDGAVDREWGAAGNGFEWVFGTRLFEVEHAEHVLVLGDRYVVTVRTADLKRPRQPLIRVLSYASDGSGARLLQFPRRAGRGLSSELVCAAHGDAVVVGAVPTVGRRRRSAPFVARVLFD